MNLKTKVILFVVSVLACTALLQRCNRPTTIQGPSKITLGGNDGDLLTIEHKDPKTGEVKKEKIYQPDPKSTVITTDDKGNVTVKVRQVGVGFEPGLGVGYSDRPRLALDCRFAYAKRFSAHTGLGVSLDPKAYGHAKLLDLVDPYVGVGYVPFTTFSNTSVIVSYTATKHVFVFVRFRF